LTYCRIENFDPGAFNNLLNLEELDISDNQRLTTLQLKSLVLPKVLKAINCQRLANLKLLDVGSPVSSRVDELLLDSAAILECPSHLCASIRVLVINPTLGISFNSFGGLEKLTLTIKKVGDVKLGQLLSLVRLKELHLTGRHNRVYDSGTLKNDFITLKSDSAP
jgi:hypothetical protein